MKPRMRVMKTRDGFTLLELLIALAVLAFGLMGVSGMVMTSVKGNAFGAQMMKANSAATDKMEEMRNVLYAAHYRNCNVKQIPAGCTGGPDNMTSAGIQVAANDSGSAGDALTGGSGDGLWTYTFVNPADCKKNPQCLPPGMTLVWGVKRNHPQPGLVWMMSCVIWGGTGAANECYLNPHSTPEIHAVRVEAIYGNGL